MSEVAFDNAGVTSILEHWPPWWSWPIKLSSHLLRRMVDRQFTEVELRVMLEDATSWRDDVVSGRFIVAARHAGARWMVIVEPDHRQLRLVVITAYPVEGTAHEA